MPKTLLLADDSVTIQKVVGISFASEDVTLVTVDNGDDAIARAKESKPDLILADVVMPGKNGYEVCAAVKADPETSHIPVLLLTGTFEAFDEERAASVGAAGHVSKPFEAQTLVDQAKRLLAESPAPAAAPVAPAAAPVAQAPPVPSTSAMDAAPPAPAVEESFDFFDDDARELAGETAPPAGDTPAPRGGLDLDSADSAFAFGDAELTPEPLATESLDDAPPGDRTVAILPDEPAAPGTAEPVPLGDALASFGADDLAPLGTALEDSTPNAASDSLGPINPAGPSGGGDFDFDFESATPAPVDSLASFDPITPVSPEAFEAPQEEPLVPVDAADLAQATILDPNGASGYDVSSSDLGDPLAFGPSASLGADSVPPSDPSAISAPTAPPTDADDDSGPMRVTAEPEPAPAVFAPPAAESPPPLPEPPEAMPALEPEEPTVSIDSIPPLPAVEALEETEPFAAIEPEPLRADVTDAALAAKTLEALTPKLRAQLHDTLEKIAWESFSDLTETIVRQAVERVEQVAWEVIPQLAETLVREEIRRMKGDDS